MGVEEEVRRAVAQKAAEELGGEAGTVENEAEKPAGERPVEEEARRQAAALAGGADATRRMPRALAVKEASERQVEEWRAARNQK